MLYNQLRNIYEVKTCSCSRKSGTDRSSQSDLDFNLIASTPEFKVSDFEMKILVCSFISIIFVHQIGNVETKKINDKLIVSSYLVNQKTNNFNAKQNLTLKKLKESIGQIAAWNCYGRRKY